MPSGLLNSHRQWTNGKFGSTDFGSTDASRSDALAQYIEIDGVAPPLDNIDGLLRYRFIVGRKGSGKTHYLRALRQRLLDADYLSLRQIAALPTDDVVSFTKAARQYHSKLIAESDFYVDPQFFVKDFWKVAWDRSIYVSVFSLIRNDFKEGDFDITDSDWERLNKFLPDADELRSPAAALSAIMSRHANFDKTRKYLHSPGWEFAKRIITNIIKRLPPIVVIVDSIDDDFEAAPEAWLYCQDGLFRAMIGQLNEATSFGNRVHVIAALRDVVYSSLLRSDHALRFVEDNHILNLKWDYRSCRNFLNNKLERVVGNTKANDEPLSSWIGCRFIQNEARGKSEPLSEFFLRHTRLTPRDVVVLCNALVDRIDHDGISTESVIEVTHEVSRVLANESILTAVNEALMSRDFVAEMVRHLNELDKRQGLGGGVSSLNVTGRDLRTLLINQVYDFFGRLGKETFNQRSLRDALVASELCEESDFEMGLTRPYRFDHILWRQGLIAYRDRSALSRQWRLYSAGGFESFLLPATASEYGLHTVVLDLFPSIEIESGSEPIF